MKYGFFDDAAREYVITTPQTPLPWINYLGSRDFFRLISNTGGGYCFYKDAKLLRLTRYRYNDSPLDVNGHYFYIRDAGCVWSIGWQPVRASLDSYVCRHGLGYTVLESAKNGLRARQETFVPKAYWTELLSRFLVRTGDGKLDRMVNIWHQYQCMVTFNMSRSASYYESGLGRGMGFRDSCQDLLGFVHLVPERARAYSTSRPRSSRTGAPITSTSP